MSPWRSVFALWKIPVTVLAAGVSGFFVPIGAWTGVSQELAIFFGLMAAAIPQAMALTAQVQPTAPLSVADATALADRLEAQQTYWFSLFVLCGIAIVLLISAKMLTDESETEIILRLSLVQIRDWSLTDVSVAPLWSAAIGATVTLLVVHLFGLGKGILSLQRLRTRFLTDAAREAAKAKAAASASDEPTVPYRPDPKFGEIVRAPRQKGQGRR